MSLRTFWHYTVEIIRASVLAQLGSSQLRRTSSTLFDCVETSCCSDTAEHFGGMYSDSTVLSSVLSVAVPHNEHTTLVSVQILRSKRA